MKNKFFIILIIFAFLAFANVNKVFAAPSYCHNPEGTYGAQIDCLITNSFGSCQGTQTCSYDGYSYYWSECSGEIPEAEGIDIYSSTYGALTCEDEIDNDCDGFIDAEDNGCDTTQNCIKLGDSSYCCGDTDGFCPEIYENAFGEKINCTILGSPDPDCAVQQTQCKINLTISDKYCGSDKVCGVGEIISIFTNSTGNCQSLNGEDYIAFKLYEYPAGNCFFPNNLVNIPYEENYFFYHYPLYNSAGDRGQYNNYTIASIPNEENMYCLGKIVSINFPCGGTCPSNKSFSYSSFIFSQLNNITLEGANIPPAEFSSLIIYPSDGVSLNPGSSVVYNVFGVYDNGTSINITNNQNTAYTFLSGGNNFDISGSKITAKTSAVVGSYDLKISYLNLNKITPVKIVIGQVVLSHLRLSPISITKNPGERGTYTAYAVYSDGHESDKTSSAKFNSSDSNIANNTNGNNIFTAKNVGGALIIANYTESSKTIYGNAIFVVSMPSSPTYLGNRLDGPNGIKVGNYDLFKHILMWKTSDDIYFEQDVSQYSSTTFASNDTNRASFDSTPKNKIHAKATGIVNISSSYDNKLTSKLLTISSQTGALPRNLILQPKYDVIEVGENWAYTLKVNFTDGTIQNADLDDCSFSSSNLNAVTISGTTITGRIGDEIALITVNCNIQNIALEDSSILEISGEITNICGDGIINQDSEECDLSDLNGETCETFGYSGGNLDCTYYCKFDKSQCTQDPEVCHENILESTCINIPSCYWNSTASSGNNCPVCFEIDSKPTGCGDYLTDLSCNKDSCTIAPILGGIDGIPCDGINKICSCVWNSGTCQLSITTTGTGGQTCVYTSTNVGDCGNECAPGQKKISYISEDASCNKDECVACATSGTTPLPGFDLRNLIFVLLIIAGYYAYQIKKK